MIKLLKRWRFLIFGGTLWGETPFEVAIRPPIWNRVRLTGRDVVYFIFTKIFRMAPLEVTHGPPENRRYHQAFMIRKPWRIDITVNVKVDP